VYERTGGHAYGSTYPGPIGAILSPLLTGVEAEENSSLPYASSLCGACFDACPVKINIPEILVYLRGEDVEAKHGESGGRRRGLPSQLDVALGAASWALSSGDRLGLLEKGLPVARALAGRDEKISRLPGLGAGWTQSRDIPAPPSESFRTWWKKREKDSTPSKRDGATEGGAR
jgi:L-lactate dehydrogenase complex protein LldF